MAWTETKDVRFVYDGWNVIREVDEVAGTTKRYAWGLDLSQSMQGAGGIGGLLAVDEGAAVRGFAFDANGNVGQLVGQGSDVVDARYEYDGFGNVVVAAGVAAGGNPWRFSTRYEDQETGLVYYGFRYYDAGLGRWTRRDPIEEQGGIGLYVAVYNSAVDFLDFYGDEPKASASCVAPPVPALADRAPVDLRPYPPNPSRPPRKGPSRTPYGPESAERLVGSISPTNPPPGTLRGPITHAEAAARYGPVDLTKARTEGRVPLSEYKAAWPNWRRWITNVKVPPEVVADSSYRLRAGGGPRTTIYDVNKDFAPALEQALRNLHLTKRLCELKTMNGTWVVRGSKSGSGNPSFHSWGIAIDVNRNENPRGEVPVLSTGFVRAFTDAGLTWGGRWHGSEADGMHFSLGL